MREKLGREIALTEQADFQKNQVSRAPELRERLCGRELAISVIGQFKRGKALLINALLRDDFCLLVLSPLTAAVTEIRKGDGFRAVARFADGSEREIGRNELPDYVSEQKSPTIKSTSQWLGGFRRFLIYKKKLPCYDYK